MRVDAPPARAPATAWFAPLPPANVAKPWPSTVSPGAGTRGVRTTKSRLAEPARSTRPLVIFCACRKIAEPQDQPSLQRGSARDCRCAELWLAVDDVGPHDVGRAVEQRELREAGGAAAALQAGDFDALEFARQVRRVACELQRLA